MKERGKLTVYTGPMFARKTTSLMEHAQQSEGESLVLKPKKDDRFGGGDFIRSHDKASYEAVQFDGKNPNEILKIVAQYPELSTVLIDEVNFCSSQILEVIEQLLVQGLAVIAAGLDLDYKKNPFGPTLDIVAKARAEGGQVHYLTANCNDEECNLEAIYTYAKYPLEQIETVGAENIFGVACEKHHETLRGDLE
jgi:thymidine kinase